MTDLTINNGSLRLATSVHGESGAPDVLFLHGVSGSRDTWEETIRHLENRCRLWTLDFRGHGHSDRADSYLVEDYISDAAAVLDLIGRPTTIIGHSLGGLVAAALSQDPHPLAKAIFLEDPPLYHGEKAEWDRGNQGTLFRLLQKREMELITSAATFKDYISVAANAPAVQGGIAADHFSQRHINSIASALQRHDPKSWDPILDRSMFASFDSEKPIQLPAMVIQAADELGAALMSGHEKRLITTNPHIDVKLYQGATHRIHATKATESRFFDDITSFVLRHQGH